MGSSVASAPRISATTSAQGSPSPTGRWPALLPFDQGAAHLIASRSPQWMKRLACGRRSGPRRALPGAKSSRAISNSLPPMGALMRSAQNAIYRSRGKKAQSAGPVWVAPCYNTIDAPPTPPHFAMREGGQNSPHPRHRGRYRSNIDVDAWAADGAFNVFPGYGVSSILYTPPPRVMRPVRIRLTSEQDA